MSKLSLLFCVLSLLVFSCGDNSKDEPVEKQKPEATERISGISISEFGKTTSLLMDYKDNGAVSIAFSPNNGKNLDARIEFNEKKKLREVISGKSRLQYLFADGGRRVGIIEGSGQSQIMFDYEGDNITAQYTILGNDTVGTYKYHYKNGMPHTVDIIGVNGYYRSYILTYSDVPNSLTNFYEMVFPADLTGQLGIPALYGKFYLKNALRVDPKAAQSLDLQENYIPQNSEFVFEINDTEKQETLKLISDGTRQWSATIQW